MKNLSRLLFALVLVVSFTNVNAQTDDNPWAITFGMNAVDVYPVGGDAPQGDYFDEYFNVEDHWNILPSLSTITVSKYVGDNFIVSVGGSINKLEKWGQWTTNEGDVNVTVSDLNYYAVDAGVKYSLASLIKSNKLDPAVGIGGGYTWIEEGAFNDNGAGSKSNLGTGTLNGSLGLTYWFTDNIGINAKSTYKHAFVDDGVKHFQHSLGLTVAFGGKDTDGDGILDKKDACIDVAGLPEFNGCPDADGDGIEDSKDECPNVAGLPEYNGCPDSDGDGVVDNKDNCPTVKGLKSLSGCPDADGDGVADGDDKCVNEPGAVANAGCPWPDTDGDSVLDKDDKCVNEPGTVANNGCPEAPAVPDAVVLEKLTNYAKTILFDTGRSSFKQETFAVLQAITGILKEYPNANFSIGGHTDSVGSKATNQRLSNSRANAVMDYLVENGISTARLTAQGFGEDYPISSNKTRAGRKENRRVEVNLKK